MTSLQAIAKQRFRDNRLYFEGIDASPLDPMAEDILRYSWTDFDTQEIKETGANVIRLWTRLYEIKRRPGEYGETAQGMIENIIERFGAWNHKL